MKPSQNLNPFRFMGSITVIDILNNQIYFLLLHINENIILCHLSSSQIFLLADPPPLLPRRGGGVYPLVSVGAHLIIVFYCYVLIKSQCTYTIYIFTFSCNFSQLFYELCMFKAISNNSSVNHVRQFCW